MLWSRCCCSSIRRAISASRSRRRSSCCRSRSSSWRRSSAARASRSARRAACRAAVAASRCSRCTASCASRLRACRCLRYRSTSSRSSCCWRSCSCCFMRRRIAATCSIWASSRCLFFSMARFILSTCRATLSFFALARCRANSSGLSTPSAPASFPVPASSSHDGLLPSRPPSLSSSLPLPPDRDALRDDAAVAEVRRPSALFCRLAAWVSASWVPRREDTRSDVAATAGVAARRGACSSSAFPVADARFSMIWRLRSRQASSSSRRRCSWCRCFTLATSRSSRHASMKSFTPR
mmetsp:Transcript_38518/g.119049  ORF Transcript_38518/g.119049 Transcript_38518/m.119049 type:complete len:295 (-) Transcript_38518:303-1187(-)